MNSFLLCLISIAGFSSLDSILKKTRLQGIYYIIHAFHNALIVWSTWDDVVLSFTTPQNKLLDIEPNRTAIALVFGLHIYHCLLYYTKFRFDDWLHHILMIGIALPIACLFPSGPLVGMSLFFTTGLPGGLDYVLLFGVRNGWLIPLLEKRINRFLNVWIRAPGAIANGALIFALQHDIRLTNGLVLLPAVLNYWNGCYFMEQVVADHARRTVDHYL